MPAYWARQPISVASVFGELASAAPILSLFSHADRIGGFGERAAHDLLACSRFLMVRPSMGAVAADAMDSDPQISIREAVEEDTESIRDLFLVTYGENYAFPQFFDASFIKKQIFSDDCLILVAEDRGDGRLLATGSVVFDVGAFADLVGEFGRLVVHPDGRGRGVGTRLMQERIARVAPHLHVGLADNRVAHAYSQKISVKHGFVPVGYLPIHNGEPVALFARHFNDSLELRRNHPRIAPAIHWLADAVMSNFGMVCDAIADESATPYPDDRQFELEEMTAAGYASLLRFERGRLRERDIFGPVKLHFGVRHLERHHTSYLLAKQRGQLVAAIGYSRDHNIDDAVRIFEIICLNECPVRFLLSELESRCRDEWGVDYLETDVGADSPRMQKTLLELGFLPIAYVPAGVCHYVERLDIVRMARYYAPVSRRFEVIDTMKPIVEGIVDQFDRQRIEPSLALTLPGTAIFQGLNAEQTACVSHLFRFVRFEPGDWIVREGISDGRAYVILRGSAEVMIGRERVDVIGQPDFIGELAMLNQIPHRASILASSPVSAAMIEYRDLTRLLSMRMDIGYRVYRNLAKGMT